MWSTVLDNLRKVCKHPCASVREMAHSVEGMSSNLEAIRETTSTVEASVQRTREAAEVLAR